MNKSIGKSGGIAGVSLVEIMISLVLVAIALIAVTSVFPNMMKNRKGIQEADQAKIIATEALEFLQIYPCSTVTSGKIGDSDFYEKYPINNPIDMGSAKYTVTKSPNVTCTGEINTVDVFVSWTKGGKNHNIKVTGALR